MGREEEHRVGEKVNSGQKQAKPWVTRAQAGTAEPSTFHTPAAGSSALLQGRPHQDSHLQIRTGSLETLKDLPKVAT